MPPDSPAGSAGRWCCTAGDMRLRIWDDDAVVFHAPSCTTHLVTPAAAAVLQALAASGTALDTGAVWRLAFGDEPGDDDLPMLNAILLRLAQAGLVTASSP